MSKRYDRLIDVVETNYEYTHQVLRDLAKNIRQYAEDEDEERAEQMEAIAASLDECADAITPIEQELA